MKIFGNIQGGGRKFLGYFKCHFESLISFKSTYKTASCIMNESKICNKSEFYYSLLKVRFQYTINCFADISTEEAPTVLLGN